MVPNRLYYFIECLLISKVNILRRMLTFPDVLRPPGAPLEIEHIFVKNKNETTDLNFIILEVEFLYTTD